MAPLGHPGQHSIYDLHSSQEWPLGERRELRGNVYAYAKLGSAAILSHQLLQSAVALAGHDRMALAAAVPAGARRVRVVLDSALLTPDFVFGKLIVVSNGASPLAEGYIETHGIGGAGAEIDVHLAEPLPVALEAGALVTLVENPYRDVIPAAAPPTAPIVGVALRDTSATQFGWIQISGLAAIRADGTLVVGQGVRPSDAVAGAVEALPTGADATYSANEQAMLNEMAENRVIGMCVDATGLTGEPAPILLSL
jgi:hypothetical protein